jgi:hypothetical protein
MDDPTTQVAFRLPQTMVERLDAHAGRLRGVQPGVRVSRTDVVRLLLLRALEVVEAERGPAAPRRRGSQRRSPRR